jgi:hypothetical protein
MQMKHETASKKFKQDHRTGAGKVKDFKGGHLSKSSERHTKSGKGGYKK